MCQFKGIINVVTIFGVIQSLLWMGFAVTGGLTYLCLVPVAPYKTDVDFFRVTFVKLYFEGPKCIPDGSYLGQFNQDYRKVIELFTPDRIFALMTAYVLLNAFYFVLSITFYRSSENGGRRGLALAWSGTTLVLCALDFALTYALVEDMFTLKDYMNKTSNKMNVNLGEVFYVPLSLALLSSRFIAIWLWNLIVGAFFFFDALCCRNVIKKTPSKKKKQEEKRKVEEKRKEEEPRRPAEDAHPSVSIMNSNFRSTFDVTSHPDFLDYKKSMEAVTRFPSLRESPQKAWSYAPNEVYWHPKTPSDKKWEMLNEGYINDEPGEPEKNLDFDHDLKNFELGQRKIKIVKPPIGKPVSIPVPPPLPPNGSCNC